MFTEHSTFRPRNGISAEAYWRIREWCEKNGFNFSDVLNAVIVPLAYYLENYCEVDLEKSKATVILNAGEVEINHILHGRCYPLASSVTRSRDTFTLKNIQDRVAHWKERNKSFQQPYDHVLLKNKKNAKISKRDHS